MASRAASEPGGQAAAPKVAAGGPIRTVKFDDEKNDASKDSPRVSRQVSPPAQPSLRLFLVTFIPYCALLAFISAYSHYTLPKANTALQDPHTGLAQFSEAKALEYVRHYSDDIGYRILGTPEMDETVSYTLRVLEDLKTAATSTNIEFEISHQKGDGHHLFDFMDKKVWKKYLGVDNVVVRLSNGSKEGKANAILFNAHLDSTLPSPGASDDAAAVAILLEVIRVITQRPEVVMNNALVFLLNGAEESFQDASHFFITQHEWRDTLRGVINLEACGTSGAESLFQASSSEMLSFYSQVPRPLGSIFAPELFATGVLLSDTDFRQFQDYGKLEGLDMALVKDSYKYHTRLDLVEYIEPGALQHFGDNILAMALAIARAEPAYLRTMKRAKEDLFFTALGGKIFIMVKARTAGIAYAALFIASVLFVARRAPAGLTPLAVLNAPFAMIASVAGANIAAAMMTQVLGKPLSYFSREWYCVPLYGCPALLGVMCSQYVMQGLLKGGSDARSGAPSDTPSKVVAGQLLFLTGTAVAVHTYGVLSSYVLVLAGAPLFFALLANEAIAAFCSASTKSLSALAYFTGVLIPILAGVEGTLSFLDVIVPLTGRIGAAAPGDHIVATLVSAVLLLVVPVIPALCHRWSSAILGRAIIVVLFATGVVMAIFAAPSWMPFDKLHPKRVLCLYMENTTGNSFHLHIAGIDGVPMEPLLDGLTQDLGLAEKPALSQINDDIAEWDVIYPISQFLHSYKFPLPEPSTAAKSTFKDTFFVELLDSRLNAVTQTRSLRLAVRHPEIIWTVIAFDADVIRWDLPAPAERGLIRHHIREAAGYGISSWELNMEVQLGPEQFQAALRQSQRKKGQRKRDPEAEKLDNALAGLRIDYSGLDVKRMWHHKTNEARAGMEFLNQLDKAMPEWVDPMLLTSVAGVAVI